MSKDTTRERILVAASDVFVEKGFDNTTVRDICTAADANVAAVNYHFGDKQKLYFEVLQLWMREYVEKSTREEGVTPDTTPEERLRQLIRAELLYLCSFEEDARVSIQRFRMLLREITADDHARAAFDNHKEFDEKTFFPILRDILGDVDNDTLKHAYFASSGILTHYYLIVMHDPAESIESHEQLEYLTDLLTTFVIGGLNALKEKNNA